MRNERLRACSALVAGCLAVAACGRGETPTDDSTSSVPPAATPLPPAATMHPADLAGVTASYDCGAIRVDVVRDTVARVNLAVDNIVKIERIAGSRPPTYQDVGLTFIANGDRATLDDETGRSLSCVAVGKPGEE